MASKLYDLKLAGFTSAGTPTTGAGHVANKAVEYWDDGSLHFTNAAGITMVLNSSRELNALLKQLVVGEGAVTTTKSFTD